MVRGEASVSKNEHGLPSSSFVATCEVSGASIPKEAIFARSALKILLQAAQLYVDVARSQGKLVAKDSHREEKVDTLTLRNFQVNRNFSFKN